MIRSFGTSQTLWLLFAAGAAACPTFGGPVSIEAQGITTSGIHGTLRGATPDAPFDGAAVRVINTATGYVTQTRVHSGSFLVRGLSPGGPYRLVVTKLGFAPFVVDGLFLTLGQELDVGFVATALVTELDTLRVSSRNKADDPGAAGIGTSISESLVRSLPTLNRDLYDFVRLVPQASTHFGISGAGANFRFNSYMIDGVSDRQLQGNNVMGAGTTGGKTISLEAIREYEVVLSAYAARYGDFTGLLVNAVTKSGTNDFHGSVYDYARNEKLARGSSFAGSSPYNRQQFGGSVGGPIIRDRLHFFIAPEIQRSVSPAPGPYVGQKAGASPTLPVSDFDVARFAALLKANGIEAGDGSRVTSSNPATTLFARLDLALPEWKSRIVFLENYSSVAVTRFARPAGSRAFPLTSNAWTLETAKHSIAFQVFTQMRSIAFNELLVSYMDRPVLATDYAASPSIQLSIPAANGEASATLIAGPPAPAGGAGSSQILAELGDYLAIQAGDRHTLGAGFHVERFSYHAIGVRGMFGLWTFASLDALSRGDASTYSISKDVTGDAGVHGVRPSAYVSDEWRVGHGLSLTLGIRADAMSFSTRPTFNTAVDSVFGRNTADYPSAHVQLSPRLGFNWAPQSGAPLRIRGGAGIFVAPPPLGWLREPIRSNGLGVRTLSCTGTPGFGKVPQFVADPMAQPVACADGRGFADGPVALVDRNLRMAESFRSSLSVDTRLPGRIDASVETLYSRVRSDFLFVNAVLAGPQSVDPHGRVLYGTFDPTGKSQPAVLDARRFPEVIDLRNHSLGHSFSATAQVRRSFADRSDLRASYSYSRSRDVQSLINGSAVAPFDIWASGRSLSGKHETLSTGISAFEVPHRLVLAGTYRAPWHRWKTELAVYYIGESGSPFTFGDSSTSRMGDLNADGTSANDPIYVPRDARDPSEITLAGAVSIAQGAAFERFISTTSCLRHQRGSIMARNSCRAAWVNTSSFSVRQALSRGPAGGLSVQLEVFNLLNLVNSSWGLVRIPNESILQHVGQTRESAPRPIFRFDAANLSSTKNLDSGYQLQLSLRYSF